MNTPGPWRRTVTALVVTPTALACIVATTAAAQAPARAARAGSLAATSHPICHSRTHEARALRLSRRIKAVLARRSSVVGIRVEDRSLGIECWHGGGRHFYSASVVKATILAALLRKAQAQHRSLTSTERSLAWAMITRSDNDAATALWNDVGMARLQRFLDLAGMKHTYLGRNGYWGLTLITAHDEMLLLRHLVRWNRVLKTASRRYELRLMANVIASQRWGVTAGAPSGFVVHVKNGWLPIPPYGYWVINSIGCFTRPRHASRDYSIVVLTDGNPTMGYGITTIQEVARVVHRVLHPLTATAVSSSAPSPSWGTPDEYIPADIISSR